MLGDATVVAVVPGDDNVRVTYLHWRQFTTVSAKAVMMCTAKTHHFAPGHGPSLRPKTAMRRTRYAPFPVINLIFDKPVYNRGYDNWCPGNSFTDFIVADWTIRNNPGYHHKYNILTFYTPLREYRACHSARRRQLQITRRKCSQGFPESSARIQCRSRRIRIYRRGHPMIMAVPGQFTKNRIAASQPMDRIYFGSNDSGGPESLTSEAVRLSHAGAEWAEMVLAGKPGAKDFAEKVLNTREF